MYSDINKQDILRTTYTPSIIIDLYCEILRYDCANFKLLIYKNMVCFLGHYEDMWTPLNRTTWARIKYK